MNWLKYAWDVASSIALHPRCWPMILGMLFLYGMITFMVCMPLAITVVGIINLYMGFITEGLLAVVAGVLGMVLWYSLLLGEDDEYF